MEKVLRVQIPFNCVTLYLGRQPDSIEGFSNILLKSSKKALTRKWMSTNAPTVENWINVIHNIFMMEKFTFSSRLGEEKY